MSNGGGESGSKHDQQHAKRKFNGDDFAQAIARTAVAQICERAGFQTFQQSALGTLSDVAVRYIHHIGKTANLYADLAGRTDGNIFDVLQGLEDLGSAQGFSGASDINHCLASSGIVRDIIRYVGESQDVPFGYSLPSFPVVKDRKPTPSFMQAGEEPPSEHIPAWLPAFPDPQTYLQLPIEDERVNDSHTKKLESAKQQRKMERSLLNMQQQLACNRQQGPSRVSHGDKHDQAAESNPFLSAPLLFEEKKVSTLVPPAKFLEEGAVEKPVAGNHMVGHHVSVLEMFAPAIEAMKKSCDSEEEQKEVGLKQGPALQFKIGTGKTSLGKPLKLDPRKEDIDSIAPWFCMDDQNDEKKKRAKKILRNSMENTQELAQL